MTTVHVAGFPHSDITGSHVCTRLACAFRSVLRPSSALDAKASSARPLYLLPRHSRRRILFGVFLACVALLSYPGFTTRWPSSIQDGWQRALRSLAASVVVNLPPAPAGLKIRLSAPLASPHNHPGCARSQADLSLALNLLPRSPPDFTCRQNSPSISPGPHQSRSEPLSPTTRNLSYSV